MPTYAILAEVKIFAQINLNIGTGQVHIAHGQSLIVKST